MNISLPSLLNASLSSFHLQERITLTTQQMGIAKIALAIFTAVAMVYLLSKVDSWRHIVTVTEEDGSVHSSPIDQVNGKVKVIWDGFWASGATAEGEFANGRLNGQGKVTYPIGKIAEEEGEFKDGWLNGQGKITYRKGDIEEGEFKDGKLR
jgi:hypothetical protein